MNGDHRCSYGRTRLAAEKSVLLKGTASAVPKVLCLQAASAAEVCFLFREARFSAYCSGVPKKSAGTEGMPQPCQKFSGTEGQPSGVPKKGGGTEGHAFTRAINRRAEGPTALPKAGAKPKAKRLNLLLLPLPLFFFHRFLPKNRMSSPQTL
jgi:hypothetical protein